VCCVNNIYRRIFNMNRWESVKLIQFFRERMDFTSMRNLRKLKFLCNLSQSDNPVIGRPFVKRFALCYRTVVLSVCLSVCLSVTLVYCGQTVGWIKMKLGMQVCLALLAT